MKNIIAFKKGLFIPDLNDKGILDSLQIVASIQAELMNLGYILSKDAFNILKDSSNKFCISYYNEIIPFLNKTLGNSKNYQPFYKNFPTQVMEMSDIELYLNAIIHYWSCGTWKPTYELKERGYAFENVEFKEIKLGTEKDFTNIFTKLVSINQSLTEDDKEIVEWFIKNYNVNKILPEVINFKETLCLLASNNVDVPIKTTTDVLRIATYMSGGDISLPHIPKVTINEVRNNRKEYFFNNLKESQIKERESFKFKKFNRKERKYLLGLLEKSNLDTSEMQIYLGRWLRLGEILHPGEYKNKFFITYITFDKLRNQGKVIDVKGQIESYKYEKIRTFNSQVNQAFNKNFYNGVNLLATRPGEFARKLDWIIRNCRSKIEININDVNFVLNKFLKISNKISNKVLFELYKHFENRTKENYVRSIMIKGKKSKMKILDPLPPLNIKIVDNIKNIIKECLINKFKKYELLGNVYIDENLKNIPLPFSMRSINTSIKTYIRGTRIPYNKDAKVIRPFIHWFDEKGNEDLDLSVGFYDKNLNGITHISYTNLKDNNLNSCHSGDVRMRQGACAEYVDIDINKCKENNVRYAIVQVHNFQDRPMHTMKDCVFGLMEREFPESNKIFVPKTITNCMTISNESSTVNICIIDLENNCYIWADIECQNSGLSNFESTKDKTLDVLKSLTQDISFSVYDLLKLHAEARGYLVFSKEEADIIFNFEDFYTDYAKIGTYMN